MMLPPNNLIPLSQLIGSVVMLDIEGEGKKKSLPCFVTDVRNANHVMVVNLKNGMTHWNQETLIPDTTTHVLGHIDTFKSCLWRMDGVEVEVSSSMKYVREQLAIIQAKKE